MSGRVDSASYRRSPSRDLKRLYASRENRGGEGLRSNVACFCRDDARVLASVRSAHWRALCMRVGCATCMEPRPWCATVQPRYADGVPRSLAVYMARRVDAND